MYQYSRDVTPFVVEVIIKSALQSPFKSMNELKWGVENYVARRRVAVSVIQERLTKAENRTAYIEL